MKKTTITEGTRIYYTGDQANEPGFGTASNYCSDNWGKIIDVVIDDGRVFKKIFIAHISEQYPDRGNRFVTLDAYNKSRRTMAQSLGWKYVDVQ